VFSLQPLILMLRGLMSLSLHSVKDASSSKESMTRFYANIRAALRGNSGDEFFSAWPFPSVDSAIRSIQAQARLFALLDSSHRRKLFHPYSASSTVMETFHDWKDLRTLCIPLSTTLRVYD
jgi:hypothetical protein